MQKRLIIDTDPGVDDALTLVLALVSPEVTIESLTIAAGNGTIAQCTHNALSLLEFFGRPDIPVFSGAQRGNSELAGSDVHGQLGLGNVLLPAPKLKAKEAHAAEALIDLINRHPGKISLLCIAPLTNLSDALKISPGIAGLIDEIVIMGGAIDTYGNNHNKNAECNFFNGAAAANVVLNSGARITLIPLDITRKALLPQSHFQEIVSNYKGRNVEFLKNLLASYVKKSVLSEEKVGILHDPLALLYLLKPDLFVTRSLRIDVEVNNPDKAGQTVEIEGVPNVNVAISFDKGGFDRLISERLKTFCSAQIGRRHFTAKPNLALKT